MSRTPFRRRRSGAAALATLGCALAGIGATASRAQSPSFAVDRELLAVRGPLGAVADVDGDGDLDVLGAGYLGEIYCQRNDGFARFLPVQGAIPTPPFGPALDVNFEAVAADFSGDGVVDLLSAAGLRFGLGGGAFGGPQPFPYQPISTLGYSFGAADVDLDGDVDVVIFLSSGAFQNLQQTTLWLNDGQGVFTDGTATAGFLPGSGAGSLIDLDQDGLADALAASAPQAFPGAVVLQRNLGGGQFAAAQSIATTSPQTPAFVPRATDVDADGLLDVIAVGPAVDAFQWTKQLAGGAFAVQGATVFGAGFTDFAVADLDDDGADEVVVLYPDRIKAASLGASGFGAVVTVLDEGGTRFFPGDFDGDGDRDFVVLDARGHRRLVFNDGHGGLHAPYGASPLGAIAFPGPAGNQALVPADHDGDGALDLVAAGLLNGVFRVFVAAGDGEGRFAKPLEAVVSGVPVGLAATGSLPKPFDLEGDGDDDYFVAPLVNGVSATAILRNDGAAGLVWLATGATPPPGLQYLSPLFADLDDDGFRDLFFPVSPSGAFIHRGLAGGAFTSGSFVPTPFVAGAFSAGDADADGDLDVFAVGFASQSFLLRNDGALAFTPSVFTGMSIAAESAIVDLDGDGDADLLGGAKVHWQTAPGVFAAAVAISGLVNQIWRPVDFDGDGDFDLFGPANGSAARNDGGGAFSALPVGWGSNAALALGDFDRDGDVDGATNTLVVYGNRTRGFALTAGLRPGGLAGFLVQGPPLGAYVLAFDLAALAAPQSTPFGRLALDPASAVPIAFGALDAQGLAVIDATLDATAGAAWLGVPFVFQALVEHGYGARLTGARTTAILDY